MFNFKIKKIKHFNKCEFLSIRYSSTFLQLFIQVLKIEHKKIKQQITPPSPNKSAKQQTIHHKICGNCVFKKSPKTTHMHACPYRH